MATHKSPSRVRRAYKFIEAHRNEFNINSMCRLPGVARAGYYAWLDHPLPDRAQEDARLLQLIRASYTASHGVYGAPRILLDLRELGETCSKHRVSRIMRENGLRALHGYRTRHIPVAKSLPLIPNLLQRRFMVSHPNEAWVTDLTYIRNWQRRLYLAVVMDLFSRKIVGLPTKSTIHKELALEAITMAVKRRHPCMTLIHSDQGTQYGSDAWRRFCKANHLEPSMSRRGNCWDGAVAESFFGSLKKERIKKRIYRDRDTAITDVSDYIEQFYDPLRRHSYLGGTSPDDFEAVNRRSRTRVN
jgi:putative transposase